MAKIGEKEAQRRAQRELAFEGTPYRSRASSVGGVQVRVVEGARAGTAALVPPRHAGETNGELATRSVLIENLGPTPLKPKRKRAPKGTFDRTAYQREYMRKKRAGEKSKKSKAGETES